MTTSPTDRATRGGRCAGTEGPDGAGAEVTLASRLSRHGDRTALVHHTGSTTYAELADAVTRRARWLGTARRLVLLEARHDPETVTTYLAALAGGHPVLLCEPDRPDLREDLVDAWDPDVLATDRLLERRSRDEGSAHDLHPDLALLLSTSGSTGSPRLVRLSAGAVQANAEAIADRLGVRGDDVAATTLPLHYCFGLSVLHTHLLRGATTWLTDHAVVDPCFWDGARELGLTSLSGVPHTFTMLDRAGFPDVAPATLRTLAQAGGRMDAHAVRRWAAVGADHGMDLVLMYGQTEATARMATLDPALVHEHPDVVGTPLPGGRFTLEQADADGVGELVYQGPNVMMGYAEAPADLARGHEVPRLRTGDLARRTPEGLWQVVGRSKRIAKVLGLRVDLDRVEQRLRAEHHQVVVVDLDDAVGVLRVPAAGPAADVLAVRAATLAGVPTRAVHVVEAPVLPRLASGKPDLVAAASLVRSGAAAGHPEDVDVTGGAEEVVDQLAAAYARVLGRRPEPEESFVDLGGDSLSFVEVSVRLEALLGDLPADWHLRSISDLDRSGDVGRSPTAHAARPGGSRGSGPLARLGRAVRLRTLDTSVVLRALAIVAIVGTHSGFFSVRAGAHVLMAVVGFNVARFVLSAAADRRTRVHGLVRAVRRVAVPSVLWLGGLALLGGGLAWHTVALATAWFGPSGWVAPDWRYWFVEALVACLVVSTAMLAWPRVERLERAHPFAFAVGLVLLGMPTHLELVVWHDQAIFHRLEYVWWLFALGWAAARATTSRHRWVVTGLVLVAGLQFFDSPARTWTLVGGLLVLVWLPRLRVPALLVPVTATLASASLWIYLTHWQVFTRLDQTSPLLATVASLVVGTIAWRAWEAGTREMHRLVDKLRPAS